MSTLIYTIGHSTLDWDEFVARLKTHGVQYLADVRTYPGSRRYPHFNAEAMGRALPDEGIEYHHFPSLGGRRSSKLVTPENLHLVEGWTHMSFRS